MRRALIVAAVLAFAAEAIAAEAIAADAVAAEDFGVLKVAPGVEATYAHCTACHSEMIIAQQGMSRARWAELMVWMREEQGMHEIPADELDLILDYLAAHYNEDRPNFPR